MLRLVFLLLPVVMCAPDPRSLERGLLDGIGSLFNLDVLKCDVQLMLDVIGSHPSEQACEGECHKLLTEGHVFNYGCEPLCLTFSTLAHQWHIVPDDADPAHSKCHTHGAAGTVAPAPGA